jgi:hypothetical protein
MHVVSWGRISHYDTPSTAKLSLIHSGIDTYTTYGMYQSQYVYMEQHIEWNIRHVLRERLSP